MPLNELQFRHYQVLKLIGSGGMGEIYLAVDQRLDRQVAVKIVRSDLAEMDEEQSAKLYRLFQREARTISMLDHPHILPLFDYGEISRDAARLTYLVMPYHAEGSLDTWLRANGKRKPLSSLAVSSIVRQAADALQYAHERQVVHQDVKSSNFLVRASSVNPDAPHLMLSDFGLALLRSSSSLSSKQARGTPSYMAPEQWKGEAVPASDQYSLAIMAYRLLTGRFPFEGDSVNVLYQHLNTPPPDASQVNEHVSAQLATVLQLALSKQVSERFPSIAAFAQAFEQAARCEPGVITKQDFPLTVSEELSIVSGSWHLRTIPEPYARNTSGLDQERRSPITIGDLPAIEPEPPEGTTTPLEGAPSSAKLMVIVEPAPGEPPEPKSPASPPVGGTPFDREYWGRPRRRRKRRLLLLAILLLLFIILGGFALNMSMMANPGPGLVATQTVEVTETHRGGTATQTVAPVIATPRTTATVSLIPDQATPTQGATPTSTRSGQAVPFQVRSVEITFDPPETTGSCLSIVTLTYIATITVEPDGPGGTVAFDYSSDKGQSYNHAELTFAPGETSKAFTFSRQLTLSLQLGPLGLDIKHTGIVTTTNPNTVTQQATPKIGCS